MSEIAESDDPLPVPSNTVVVDVPPRMTALIIVTCSAIGQCLTRRICTFIVALARLNRSLEATSFRRYTIFDDGFANGMLKRFDTEGETMTASGRIKAIKQSFLAEISR